MNDKPEPQDCPVLFLLGTASTLSSPFSLLSLSLLLLFDFKFHSLRVYQQQLTKTSAILRKLPMEHP